LLGGVCANQLTSLSVSTVISDMGLRCQFHQHFTYSFYACRSQKRKKIQLSHKYLFTLLGSESVKAERRTLMKLSPAATAVTTEQQHQQPNGYDVEFRSHYDLYVAEKKT